MLSKVEAKWVGKIISSKKWGDARILDYRVSEVDIEFLNSGNRCTIKQTAIYANNFADNKERLRLKNIAAKDKIVNEMIGKITPSVYNIGYIGFGEYSSKNKEFYTLWREMIRRCYDKGEGQLNYKDCFVVDRWHNFQNFCEDIPKLPGYDLWSKFNRGPGGRNLYQLDKDTRDPGNKIYCPDLCHFITHTENSQDALKKTFFFEKEGEVITVVNLAEWCRDNNKNYTYMCQLAGGRVKQAYGYKRIVK